MVVVVVVFVFAVVVLDMEEEGEEEEDVLGRGRYVNDGVVEVEEEVAGTGEIVRVDVAVVVLVPLVGSTIVDVVDDDDVVEDAVVLELGLSDIRLLPTWVKG